MKEASKVKDIRLFEVTAVKIVDGWRVLGSAIGNQENYKNFNVTAAGKYSNWLKNLGHVAINVLSKRLGVPVKRCATKKLYFMSRITATSRNIFTDAEANIQTHVLTPFFDSHVSQSARRLYSLATREGGLNIKAPIDYEAEYAASLTACAPEKRRILQTLISPKNA